MSATTLSDSHAAPDAHAHGHAGYKSRRFEWMASVDHKQIGVMYMTCAMFFLVVAGCEALLMRLQLAFPNNHVVSPLLFNQLFTMHGTSMVFLVGMPVLSGFQNYFVPLMVGARDVAFPRFNALAFWLFPIGGTMLNFSFLTGAAPEVGWFSYAPLSERAFTSTLGPDYYTLGLLALGISSVGSSFNIIATVLKLRPPGMSLQRVPLFVWMSFITSILTVLALPALNAGLVMLTADRMLDASFFKASGGGDPLFWQHVFWVFGHPEVYILVLPAFGMVSEIIPVFSRRPITGHGFIAVSTVAIALLGFGVWAHHMFVAGLGIYADAFFAVGTMLIAIPTGVKVLNWTSTMWRGRIKFATAMLFCIGFLIVFVCGGVTGVMLAVTPYDWAVSDSYFIIAHFHYVLVGGTVFGLFAGAYYWYPKITGRMLDEKLGRIHFWGTMIGFNMTFFVQHFLGLMGMPRRIYTYPDLPGWGALNLISSIGALIFALGTIPFIYNVIVSNWRGKIAGDNPWNAWTLEWATTSPPPHHNFDSIPPIHGPRPLWDLAHPDDMDIKREPTRDEPPIKMHLNKVLMIFFISSEGVFFSILISAYILFNHNPPPDINAHTVLNIPRTWFFSICLFASSWTMHKAEHYLRAGNDKKFSQWLMATILLGLTFVGGQALEYTEMIREGITIGRNIFGSTFFTLTGFHGIHVFAGIIALAIFWGLGKMGENLKTENRVESFEALGWYWHFVDVVWVLLFVMIYHPLGWITRYF